MPFAGRAAAAIFGAFFSEDCQKAGGLSESAPKGT